MGEPPRIDLKEILSQPPIELCEKCKNCQFNKNPNNKHKPCYYEYCKEERERYGRI